MLFPLFWPLDSVQMLITGVKQRQSIKSGGSRIWMWNLKVIVHAFKCYVRVSYSVFLFCFLTLGSHWGQSVLDFHTRLCSDTLSTWFHPLPWKSYGPPARWTKGGGFYMTPGGRWENSRPRQYMNMYDVCECVMTSSNLSLNAICKIQPLSRVDKLLAPTANSALCLCVGCRWQRNWRGSGSVPLLVAIYHC